MIIRNAKNWSPHSLLNAAAWSFVAFAVISFMMFNLGRDFYSAHSYKFYFIAATFISYYFGYKPAALFIVISSIFANFFFVAPFGEFIFSSNDVERYLLNLSFGSIAIILIELVQRERFKFKLLLLVSESRYLILLQRDNQLLQELKRKHHV